VFFPWLIFLAVSEGLGFTLMAVGQNYSPPTHAAIILSLEGVFASVASYMFLDEVRRPKTHTPTPLHCLDSSYGACNTSTAGVVVSGALRLLPHAHRGTGSQGNVGQAERESPVNVHVSNSPHPRCVLFVVGGVPVL